VGVGGVERGSNRCFLIPVERRDKDTLLKIIEEWIFPGTTIMLESKISNNFQVNSILNNKLLFRLMIAWKRRGINTLRSTIP